MDDAEKNGILFCDYYENWIEMYKKGSVREVTYDKYMMALKWLRKIAPDVKLENLDRITYQKILNEYAKSHEKQTVTDFHHLLGTSIKDAVDEGILIRDPTRRAIIKGKTPSKKKIKYLNQYELHKLLEDLDLEHGINWDWFILLVAKTGMRFAEALALTPADFDFAKQTVTVNKTWGYKKDGGFQPTKNKSSMRKIPIDWKTSSQFAGITKGLPETEPIFVKEGKAIYNTTANDVLERHCKACGISVISIHGLRHTHASLLLFAGASIASVAKRLGHSNMTTTQKVYLHIIQELENQDVDIVMRSMAGLG